jgi:hypothetical protein
LSKLALLLQVYAMPAIRVVGTLCLGLSIATLSSGTHAADLLGLYMGAAAGQATIRADGTQLVGFWGGALGAASISNNDTGWKAMLGVRPISRIGAELEYIDFGHTSQTPFWVWPGYSAALRAKAPAAFGVLYAPIPVPAFDLYGKVGMASLHSTVNEIVPGPQILAPCSPTYCPPPVIAYINRERTDTRLAYGGGLQVKLLRFAIRAEYERISASTGDPSLFSLGLTWRFD